MVEDEALDIWTGFQTRLMKESLLWKQTISKDEVFKGSYQELQMNWISEI